ncbi:MAG: hypothetical protein ACREJ3_14680, partial [Polyangiaceae bacterium]
MQALQAAAQLDALTTRSLAVPQAASPTSWFPLGPTPLGDGPSIGGTVPAAGRATVIASNPTDPSEVWLGTATGGVWHTLSAQNTDPTWVPIGGLDFPDSLPGPGGKGVAIGAMALSIGALAVDGCSASGSCTRVWIGTGEDAVRRDTYYGAGLFLQTPTPPPPIPQIAIKPSLSAATEPPTQVAQIADFRYGSIVRIALAPHAAGTTTNTLYAAVSSGVTSPATESTVTAPAPSDGYGIYMTTDASTFTKLPIPGVGGSLPTDIEIDPNDASGKTLLAGFMARDPFDT